MSFVGDRNAKQVGGDCEVAQDLCWAFRDLAVCPVCSEIQILLTLRLACSANDKPYEYRAELSLEGEGLAWQGATVDFTFSVTDQVCRF